MTPRFPARNQPEEDLSARMLRQPQPCSFGSICKTPAPGVPLLNVFGESGGTRKRTLGGGEALVDGWVDDWAFKKGYYGVLMGVKGVNASFCREILIFKSFFANISNLSQGRP